MVFPVLAFPPKHIAQSENGFGKGGGLPQLEFRNHDWSWLITKNYHVKWNIFHDLWLSNLMIFFRMTHESLTGNWPETIVISRDKIWIFIMSNHDISWLTMIKHHPFGRGRLFDFQIFGWFFPGASSSTMAGMILRMGAKYIVACQRGGVSNKPILGLLKPTLGLLKKRETDRTFDPLFTKAGWAWHITIKFSDRQ